MPGYNSNNNRRYRSGMNLDRFQSDSDERKSRGQSSLGAFNQIVQANDGLLGEWGKEEQGFQGTIDDASAARDKLDKGTAGYNKVNDLIQNAMKGAGDDWAKSKANFLKQNKYMTGKAGKGLLGMFGKTGAGQAVKAWGTKMAGSALGQKAVALSAGIGAVAAPLMAAKQVWDFAGQQVDRYEGIEEGIATGNVGQKDIKSERREAKSTMLGKNQELATRVKESKGILTKQLGSKAEQVLSGAEMVQSKSNLQNSDSSNRINDMNRDGIKSSWVNNSDALQRQQKAGNLSNANMYADENQGLMGRAQDLQAQIDSLDQERKDMKGMYQVSKMIRG